MFSIDNEREDIQKAFHRNEDQKRENYYESQRIIVSSADYADSPNGAISLSSATRRLVEAGGGKQLFYKENLFLDIPWEDLAEQISLEIIIPDGYDAPITNSEDILIDHHFPNDAEVEISVEIFTP